MASAAAADSDVRQKERREYRGGLIFRGECEAQRNASGKVLKANLRREYGAADSYDAGPVDTPLLDETIGANFERTALAYPDVEALVDVAGGRRWTALEVDGRRFDIVDTHTAEVKEDLVKFAKDLGESVSQSRQIGPIHFVNVNDSLRRSG